MSNCGLLTFTRMFFVFLARTLPASSNANPACMKNTRMVPNRSQKVSALEVTSSALQDMVLDSTGQAFLGLDE